MIYRLVKVTKTDTGFTLHLVEDGIEEPGAEGVLAWEDEHGVLWIHWDGRDYRVDNMNVAGLDFTNSDAMETTIVVGYQRGSNNAG